MLSFDIKELHMLFRNFYIDVDEDENLTFEYDEMINCFETFSKEDYIGRKCMKKVFNSIGVDHHRGIIDLLKEG